MKPPHISAQRLEKIYGSGASQVRALHDASISIASGEFLVLMGPSGSGKTTLLSLLAGILTPTAGTVEVFGTEITPLSMRERAAFRRKYFGFVFQGFNLFGALTARENVEVALSLKGTNGRAIRPEADRLLARVGIGHCAKRLPRDLSGGEKQRVSIARALACHPAVIIADEPTASLDFENGNAVIVLLRALAKEEDCTVIIATHDVRIVDTLDRVVCLADGVLRERP